VVPGAPQPGQCALTTDFCYRVSVAAVNAEIPADNLSLEVLSSTGGTDVVSIPTFYVYWGSDNYLEANGNPSTEWTSNTTAPLNGPITVTAQFWIQFTVSPYGLGYGFVVKALSGDFDGATVPITLP
jgi:hypothetical protein